MRREFQFQAQIIVLLDLASDMTRTEDVSAAQVADVPKLHSPPALCRRMIVWRLRHFLESRSTIVLNRLAPVFSFVRGSADSDLGGRRDPRLANGASVSTAVAPAPVPVNLPVPVPAPAPVPAGAVLGVVVGADPHAAADSRVQARDALTRLCQLAAQQLNQHPPLQAEEYAAATALHAQILEARERAAQAVTLAPGDLASAASALAVDNAATAFAKMPYSKR
jgi:hypothetical protein